MTLREDDLIFSFDGAVNETRFDDKAHATDTIQPVDFLIEYDDHYLFVEVKDPDCPDVKNVEAFRKKLRSGELTRKLAGKYRDTFFSFGFQQKPQKKIQYIVLLAFSDLTPELLLPQIDRLKKAIPIQHDNWKVEAAAGCVIFNLEQYKKRYGSESVQRVSEQQVDSGQGQADD